MSGHDNLLALLDQMQVTAQFLLQNGDADGFHVYKIDI